MNRQQRRQAKREAAKPAGQHDDLLVFAGAVHRTQLPASARSLEVATCASSFSQGDGPIGNGVRASLMMLSCRFGGIGGIFGVGARASYAILPPSTCQGEEAWP